MSIEKLIAENAADARELWLDSLPESIEFEASTTVSHTKPVFSLRRKAKVLAALFLCLAFSFVALANEVSGHINISYYSYNKGYVISFKGNFDEELPWRQITFDYLPEGYHQVVESHSEYDCIFGFNENTDSPNPYVDKAFDITFFKLDKQVPSQVLTFITEDKPLESHVTINENNSLILTLGITSTIVVSKENYVVMVNGTLPRGEMIKIVENIKIKEN